MAKPRVYVETTIASYLTSRPSRDVVAAARQQLTQDWWDQRAQFELYLSELVLQEAGAGDPKAAQARLAVLEDLPLLEVTEQAVAVAKALIARGIMPPQATRDAFHLAIAALHRMDFLVTWNCRHLANAVIQRSAYNTLSELGHDPPTICTPDQFEGSNRAQV